MTIAAPRTVSDPTAADATTVMFRSPELVRQAAALARAGTFEIDRAAAFWTDGPLSDGTRAVINEVIDRARHLLTLPLHDVVSGVPCSWCSDDDAWACTRVWDDHSEDPLDVEVCARCASRLLDSAPDWVRSEPMTEDDYARHGLHAGPQLPTEWDTALATLPTAAWDPADVLDFDHLGGAA